MRNLKLVLEYEGTRYRGWQKQTEDVNTIQGKLEAVLSKMTGEEIQVIGCGRTDTGVHALNYIANFHTESTLTNEDIRNYLTEYLPEDIVVKSVADANERFHARYNAKSKTYVYTIDNGDYRNVFARRYSSYVKEKLNVNVMMTAAEILVGTHDFQSFTSLKAGKKPTVRTINYIDIVKEDGLIKIEVNGDGFLLNMVRIIAGTLIEVGKGNLKPMDIGRILEEKKRSAAGPMAEGRGLCLKEVQYS